MALKIASRQKLVQNVLIDARHRGCIKGGLAAVTCQQLHRQHQIADTDGRRNTFGKGSQINDPSAPIHALQRRNWFSTVTEFTVVIIFYDIAVRCFHRPL